MEKAPKSTAMSIGLAMFAMFFGAGNITFPIVLGQWAGDHNFFAIMGLLVTAVIVPFLALATMLTYNGDYKRFFGRIGQGPGFFVAIVIMALIGPFGAMPRCISLSYSTLSIYMPSASLPIFSFLACILIFVLAYKKNNVMNILGFFLTPILLISLFLIIALGLYALPDAKFTGHSDFAVFFYGLKEGYNTMDIFAACFFSIVVLPAFKSILGEDLEHRPKSVAGLAIKSSIIGMCLLAFIYASMSFIAAGYSGVLQGVPEAKQLGTIANHVLGPYAGLVANLAVSLACLTTAITLAVVFAEFLREEIFRENFGYIPLLIVTLIIGYFFSLLGFGGIVAMVKPILVGICPALIVLTLCNLAHRFYGFKPVLLPVYLTFGVTLVVTYWF